MASPPVELTQLLKAFSKGDASVQDQLFELVYRDLRKRAGAMMRRERPGNTLQPTALINEVYLKIARDPKIDWQDREHFFKFATEVMRRVLIDAARKRAAEKRGGPLTKVSLDDVVLSIEEKDIDLLALDQALIEFERVDPDRSYVVKLRYFSEFSIDEIAEITGRSPATVKRHLNTGYAWLRKQIEAS